MTEIEVKIIGIKPAEIRKKLLDLGAKKTFKGTLIAKVFDFPDCKLGKQGGHLRLRKVGDERIELTYKEKIPSKEFKKRIELINYVSDYNLMLQILKKLGLKEVNSYIKTREKYQLVNMHFDLDIYPKSTRIPPLVEIESTEEGVKKGVRLLGFQMKDTSTASVWGLLEFYKNKKR